MTNKTTGQQLSDLKDRSGLTLDEIATAAGYKTRSGVQAFFSPTYERALSPSVAAKLTKSFRSAPNGKIDGFGIARFPKAGWKGNVLE